MCTATKTQVGELTTEEKRKHKQMNCTSHPFSSNICHFIQPLSVALNLKNRSSKEKEAVGLGNTKQHAPHYDAANQA